MLGWLECWLDADLIEWLKARGAKVEPVENTSETYRVMIPQECAQLESLTDGQTRCRLQAGVKPRLCREFPVTAKGLPGGCGFRFEE